MRGFLISKETLSVRMLDDSQDPTPLLKEIRDDKVSTIIIDANASISHLILRKVGTPSPYRVRGRSVGDRTRHPVPMGVGGYIGVWRPTFYMQMIVMKFDSQLSCFLVAPLVGPWPVTSPSCCCGGLL